MVRIHPSSYVDDSAELEANVEVGPFTVIHGNVVVKSGTRVGSHCIIGEPSPLADGRPLHIGEDSLIRSHSTLYEGSTFGPDLETGHHVTLREGITAGRNLRVGTLGDIQGDCIIGEFVRLHSSVFVSKLAVIGNFVWIFPFTVLTNDPTPPTDKSQHVGVAIDDYAVIAANCCVVPGVRIGRGSFVGAMSLVTRDVAPGMAVRGSPAREFGPVESIRLRKDAASPAYPWRNHYTSGYPKEAVDELSGRKSS